MLTFRTHRVPQFAHPGQRDFDRLVNAMFRGTPSPLAAVCGCAPAGVTPLNIWEDEQNVYVEAETPGIPMDNLDISFNAGELSIKGSRPAEPATEGVVFHRRERSSGGEFVRSVRLTIPIEEEKIAATLTAGVLRVTLPKSAEAKPRKITVAVK